MQFLERVSCKSGLLHAEVIERVFIHENEGIALQPFGIGLESRRIHSDKHVAEIARCIYLMITYMYLKT